MSLAVMSALYLSIPLIEVVYASRHLLNLTEGLAGFSGVTGGAYVPERWTSSLIVQYQQCGIDFYSEAAGIV